VSLSSDTFVRLPRVNAVLHYLKPMSGKPCSYTYELPQGVPQTNTQYEPRTVAIGDARRVADLLSLDDEGVQLVEHKSAVRDYDDDDEVKRVYYPEAEKLVAAATGARWVLVFDHTVRKKIYGVADRTPGLPRQPATRVHNDYTERSGPQRVRDLTGEAAEALLRRRFAVINVWRPFRGPLYDSPLALCDANSTRAEDFVASDLMFRDRIGETYAVKYNPAHRWLYISGMQSNEALLLKCYDSVRDGVARFTPHSAFEDPSAPADRLERESIELRTIAFFAD
jgi:hypothetical protein